MGKKHYIIYKTINKINKKIYVGKHETDNLDDGYLGSGKYLWNASKKYGRENFEREILFEYKTSEEMNQKEAEIVDEEFVKRENTYNLKLGGEGSWSYVNQFGLNKNDYSMFNDPKYKDYVKDHLSE